MKKFICCLLSIAASYSSVFAQDENDALRYSFSPNYGSARGMSIGSALGSIGGDFSTLSVNPAGIGVYRKSEFAITPSITVGNNKASYLGVQTTDNMAKFNLNHIGFVITSSKKGNSYKTSRWKTFSFGFGMNRIASFKNEMTYTGTNTKSSIVERWSEDFNKLGGLNNFSIGSVNYAAFAAYQTWLIDKDYTAGGDSSKARSYVPYADGIRQTKRISESGGQNEYVLNLGGNYMEKLMLGATVGIQSVNYKRDFYFNEEDVSGNTNNDFKYMNFQENLVTTGLGANLKLGAIIKPSQNFRFGVAFHTPTHLELNDVSSISMTSHTDSFLLRNNLSTSQITTYEQDSSLVFNYSLNTPYKALASATVLFKQFGFLTADIEYVNYSTMRYKFDNGFENESDAVNTIIKNTYTDALNIRVGAEAKLKDLSLRAGYGYYGSPYASTVANGARTQLSAGLGYRTNTWFLDIAYVYAHQSYKDLPYALGRVNANVQSASIDKNTGNAMITMGWKF